MSEFEHYDCDPHLHELLGLKHPKHVRAVSFINTKEAEKENLGLV